jgi:hypothetical protein
MFYCLQSKRKYLHVIFARQYLHVSPDFAYCENISDNHHTYTSFGVPFEYEPSSTVHAKIPYHSRCMYFYHILSGDILNTSDMKNICHIFHISFLIPPFQCPGLPLLVVLYLSNPKINKWTHSSVFNGHSGSIIN